MIELLAEPMESDDDELKIGSIKGIIGTLSNKDDDDA